MKLIVGLGNPGPKYHNTRHNVGFILLDALAYKYQLEFSYEKKFNAETVELNKPEFSPEPVLLVKPHTFMNNSGEAIQKIAHFYKITPENIYVIFDELDLPLGQIKIRKSGSAGTHNGMKSMVAHLGTEFPRFRVGIESRGTTASVLQDTSSFVLSEFIGKEKILISEALEKTIEAIETTFSKDLDTAMNKFN